MQARPRPAACHGKSVPCPLLDPIAKVRRSVAAIAIAGAVSGDCNAQAAPIVSHRVAILFDRRYSETDAALSKFKLQVSLLPPTRVRALGGETLWQLAVRLYGFGASKPRYFSEIESRIKALNKTADLNTIVNGEVLVPTAARWSPPVGYDPDNPELGYRRDLEANQRPVVTTSKMIEIGDSLTSDTIVRSLSDEWIQALFRPENKGSFSTVLVVDVTDSTELARMMESGAVTIVDAPLDMVAGEAIDDDVEEESKSFLLTAEERVAIETILASSSGTSIPLVIFDPEWPSASEGIRATEWLRGVLNRVRRAHGVALLRTQPLPQIPDRPKAHSTAIGLALEAMVSLDLGGRVAVRYLPMVAPAGADSLLVDLVSTYLLLRGAEGVPGAHWDRARTEAENVVKKLPKVLSNDDAAAIQGSRAILDALIFVLDRDSRQTNLPYLINTSWTSVKPLSEEPGKWAPRRGLIVSAPGNFRENVVESARDLSRWTAAGNSVLSVENRNEQSTPLCQSSYFPNGLNARDDGRIVAFRGGRAPERPFRCGTSFSAPRVAWTIAAWLASQGKVNNWDLWGDRLQRRIRSKSVVIARDSTPQFSISAFLSQ